MRSGVKLVLVGLVGFLGLLPAAAPARAEPGSAAAVQAATAGDPNAPAAAAAGPMLDWLAGELQYSLANLTLPDGTRPYFLAYTVTDRKTATLQAALGALESDTTTHRRFLDVEARVGDYALDSTHKLRGGAAGDDGPGTVGTDLCLEDDADAIRQALWLATDAAFKAAASRYQRVQTDLKTKVAEEDQSGDLTREQPSVYSEPAVELQLDRARWAEILRTVSQAAREFPLIYSSEVTLTASAENRWLVTSEGTRLQTGRKLLRVAVNAATRAADGMELSQSFIFDAATEDTLPSPQELADAFAKVVAQVLALRTAPLVEPYVGPAILLNRASGVFFHEIFGHRIEGHRQKDVEEGQTFARKLGEEILPAFITVHDDPTRRLFGAQALRGHYRFDDEGVASQDVCLVDNGVLRTFLMSRSPLESAPRSNGHGRREPGRPAVARQGNLIIESSRTVSFEQLRQQLIDECRRQDKPYGLLFEDITGGFTGTRRGGAQSFKVLPVVVYRVYADGRPDELVRGVDIVGTPLTCFSKILAAADDPAVFNGSCGAESGWVPVSAVSPSILVGQIEVEKRQRQQDKPPILPPPIAEKAPAAPAGSDDDVVLRALADELERTRGLQVEDLEKPYFVQFDADDQTSCQLAATYGALTTVAHRRARTFRGQVRVGGLELDNTNFVAGGRRPGGGAGGQAELPTDDDYLAIRQAIWRATDADYKSAVETLTQKRAYLKDRNIADRPADFTPAPAVQQLEPRATLQFDEPQWRDNLKRIAARFKQYAQVQDSGLRLTVGAGNRYLVNSDGTRLRTGDTSALLTLTATVQADDGMRLSDSRTYGGDSTADLPALETILADVDALVADLTAARAAPVLERYTGPVLFEGLAAPQMFRALLAGGLGGRPEPVGESRRPGGESLETRLGTRILPKSLQVWDDPTQRQHGDTPLLGHYRYDAEGVPAARVGLVTDGQLESLCLSRVPTRKLSGTNGHARRAGGGTQAGIGCLFIADREAVSTGELRAALISAAADAGLEYGIHVKSLQGREPGGGRAEGPAAGRLRRGAAGGRGAGGLADPVIAYRVFVADGREEPLRGCEFGPTEVAVLKKIIAAGDTPVVYNYAGGPGGGASIIAPAVLLEELELSKIEQEHEKPPILKAPLARQ